MNREPSYTLSCDYEEFHPSTYRGYVVKYEQVDMTYERRFDTGNLVQDWSDVLAFLWNVNHRVIRLSSCDNFVADMRRWLQSTTSVNNRK